MENVSEPYVKPRNSGTPLENQNSDRISALHDSILHYILSFIPTKYVVQTCILSKRWQKLWTSIPYFNFEDLRRYEDQTFINFVEKFLQSHDKSRVLKFRLACFYSINDHNFIEWISTAVRAGVEEIDLYALYTKYDSMRMLVDMHLPSCLFTCKSLVVLKLHFPTWIKFPVSFCFPNMKSMHLFKVTVPESFIQQLFNSPNLETLILQYCHLDNISPPSSHTLRNLIADDHHRLSRLNLLVINLPCCKYPEAGGGFYVSKLIRKLYNVKALHICRLSITLLRSEKYLLDCLPTFCNLKHLVLTIGTHTKRDVRVLACLLKSSPALQSLHIKLFNISEPQENLKAVEVPQLSVPERLKWIRMDHYQGRKNQFGLVRFFLKNAKSLEKMIVGLESISDADTGIPNSFPVLDEGRMHQELLQLPNISPSCVLDIRKCNDTSCVWKGPGFPPDMSFFLAKFI